MTGPGVRTPDLTESALGDIYEVSKLLAAPNRLERTLASVLSNSLDLRHGLFALLDKDGDPEIVVGSGWSAVNARQLFERLPERAIDQMVAAKTPLVVENALASARRRSPADLPGRRKLQRRRRHAQRPQKADQRHGAGRLGQGQGRASPRPHAAADRLRAGKARHSPAQVLTR